MISKYGIFIHPFNIILLFLISTGSIKSRAGLSISVSELTVVFLIISVCSAALLIFYKKLAGDFIKASLLLSFSLLVILFFRDIVELFVYFGVPETLPFTGENFLVILLSVLLIFFLFKILKRTKKDITRINSYFNLLTTIFLTVEILGCSFSEETRVTLKEKIEPVVQPGINETPDIYFILLDGYTGFKGLKKLWNFDNRNLSQFFADKNIFCAEYGRSSYNVTNYSMVSTFNMSELSYKYEDLYAKENYLQLAGYMEDNPIVKFFEKTGYDFYNLTFWDINGKEKLYEDIYFLKRGNIYQSRTLLGHLYEIYNENFSDMAEINTGIFRKLSDLSYSNNSKPKFVYAHITMPHPPYYYDAEGNRKDFVYSNDKKDMNKYLEQLKFTNKLIMQTTGNLLEAEKKPVIIIQSDHGFRSYEGKDKKEIEYSVLNCFYFPDEDYSMLNDSLKTINTFRIILNKYFSHNFELIN